MARSTATSDSATGDELSIRMLDRGNSLPGRVPGDSDCWNHIGVAGDRSCPELETFIHCRNCPVFSAAARTFFDRPAPEGYLAGWSRWLMGSAEQDARVEANGDDR